MMTVEKVLKLLLDMDERCISPRPSLFGEAAELVAELADHAEPSFRSPERMGDWRAVDLTPVRKPAGWSPAPRPKGPGSWV